MVKKGREEVTAQDFLAAPQEPCVATNTPGNKKAKGERQWMDLKQLVRESAEGAQKNDTSLLVTAALQASLTLFGRENIKFGPILTNLKQSQSQF